MAKHELRFSGNLGTEPELRYTKLGKEITSFSVGVNDSYKPKGSEEWVEKTIWFRVSCFGALAGLAKDGLHKGSKVSIVGKLQHDNGSPRIWVDRDSKPRASFEVMAFNIEPEDGVHQDELPARQIEDDDSTPF